MEDERQPLPPRLSEDRRARLERVIEEERRTTNRWTEIRRDAAHQPSPPAATPAGMHTDVVELTRDDVIIDLTDPSGAARVESGGIARERDPAVRHALLSGLAGAFVAVAIAVAVWLGSRGGGDTGAGDAESPVDQDAVTSTVAATLPPTTRSTAVGTATPQSVDIDPPEADPAPAIDQALLDSLTEGSLELTAYYTQKPATEGMFSFAVRLRNAAEVDVPLGLVKFSATTGGSELPGVVFIGDHDSVPAGGSAVGTIRVMLPAESERVTVLVEANSIELGRTTIE